MPDQPVTRVTPYCWGTSNYTWVQYEGQPISVIEKSTSKVCLNWTRTGIRLPNWRQRVADGLSATTPLTATNWKVGRGAFSIPEVIGYKLNPRVWDLRAGGVTGGLAIPIPPDPLGITELTAVNKAKVEAVKSLRKRRRSFDGSTFVAELRDTITGLRNPAKALRRSLDTWHSRAKKRVTQAKHDLRATSRVLADEWLEFQFGAKPLGNDIRDAIRLLNSLGQTRSLRFGGKGTDFLPWQIYPRIAVGSHVGYSYAKRLRLTAECRYKGAVRFAAPIKGSLLDWGLGTEDFIPGIYNGIPYTFALDYFSNIGDVLLAWSTLVGDVSWLKRSVRRVSEVELSDFRPEFGAAILPLSSSVVQLPREVKVTRTIVRRQEEDPSTLTDVKVEWNVLPFQSLKWLNLAALARLKLLR